MKNVCLKLLVLLLFFSACQKEQLDEVASVPEKQIGWEKQKLLNLGFAEEDIEERATYFIVQGDIVINKSTLQEMHIGHDQDVVEFRQRRTPFLVDPNIITDIRVQIDNGFNSDWNQLIRQALDNWNTANTPVVFRVVNTNPHITIYPDTSPALPASHFNLQPGICGFATGPDNNGNPGPLVSINRDSPGMKNNDQRIYVVTHELGHCIGLVHTDRPLDGPRITCTPNFEAESIMNADQCGRTIPISANDALAIRKLYACSNWGGWTDPEDLSLTGDITGDQKEELVLINTSYSGGAIRTLDLTNGNDLNWINHGNFQGWMDPTDRVFLGDVDGNGKKDLIFQNTRYLDGAIRVVDLSSGNTINSISHGTFQGWMDDTDKSFVGDVNNDGREDMILVNDNPGTTNGAIRVVDLLTGNTITTINHGNFQGWMNASDRLLLGDANGDGREDLIFQNTSYTDGALRIVDLVTGLNINSMSHNDPLAAFQGWMDAADKSFVGDVNADGREDLILVNNDPSTTNGAIRVVDLISKTTINTINHGNFQGWMDTSDQLFIGDVNNDGRIDLVFQNTDYSGGALRVVDLLTGLNINSISHGSFGGWMDGPDNAHLCDSDGDGAMDFLLINKDPNKCGGVFRAVDLIQETDLLWIDYCD